ncbi:MAG: TniQ family protein [Burkholderiaceae bacterium]|nr:TniQ family protein [Burkholderiaceae bacterium]
MKPLARPAPALHESWPGYLDRVAHLNHLNGVQGIADLLGVLPYRLLVSSPRIVLTQLGISLPSIESAVLDTPLQPDGRVYLARAGRSIRTRICPECARENKNLMIPAEWDAALTFKCHVHHVQLLDACTACGRALSYEHSSLIFCSCGHSLRMERARKISNEIEAVLSALSFPPERKLRLMFAPSTDHEVMAAWLIRRLLMIDAGLFHKRRAARMKGDAFVTASEIQAVSPWFIEWPNAFLAKLAEANYAHKLSPTKMMGLGPSRLEKNLPEVSAAVIEFDSRRRHGKRPAKSSGFALARNPWMGLKQLMLQTGASYHAAQTWIRSGWLGDVRVQQESPGGTRYLIETESAVRFIKMVHRTSSVRTMASDIGLEVTALRCLIRARVVQGIPCGLAQWNVRLAPAPVFKLAQTLLSAAVLGKPSNAEVISLSTAICRVRKHDPSVTAAFVAAVISRELRTRTFIPNPVSLEEVTLRVQDFVKWLRRRS